MKRIVFVFVLTVLSLNSFSQTKAFPSIKGAGSYVTGGRGGIVVKVTNLNNSGPGSLRAALMMTVPRTIVFEVSGTITLTSAIELIQENSNFTVAGQTAPEGGITISNHLIQMGGGYNRPSQPCNNVIWRYVRFRNGRYNGQPDVREHNGIISTGCDGLVFDHCSFSFCDDQAISMGGDWGALRDITIQNCVFSENATAVIVGLNSNYPTGDMTSINNLYVDQGHRTPNAGGTLQYDIINNVYFNWGSRLTNANAGSPEINFIGNYLKPGDFTLNGSANKVQNITGNIYTANNYHSTYYTTPQVDDRNLWQNFYTNAWLSDSHFSSTMHPLLENPTITTAQQAYTDVLSDVGANKFLNPDGSYGNYQDSFDVLKIGNVQNNISSDPFNKNWTLPTLPNNSRPSNYDSDNDGMADLWELNTFNSLSNDGTVDTDGNGYPDLEDFLNGVDIASTSGSQVSISADTTIICEGQSVTLTASGADSYDWSPNSETTSSISVSPTVTTTYTVTGTHSDGSTTQDTVTITVNELPIANAGEDVETCIGTSVTLTASGGTSYQWNTGETSASITVNPTQTTTYSVEVTQNGCVSTDAVLVTVNDLPIVDAGEDQTIFIGESVTLTATGADTYLWSTGETTQTISVNPILDTSYSVTGTTNNCQSSDTVTVFLVDDSVVANAGDDTGICNGESVILTASGGSTYLWSTGETTQNIEVSPTETTTYTVTAFSVSGNNQDQDSVTVTVNAIPQADAGTDVSICAGESTVLTATGGSTYLWSNGETSQSISVSPLTTTNYTVEVSENNCSSIATVVVSVNALPNTNAGQDVTITEGASTTLTATGADTYLWSTGETTASITVSPAGTTTYNVTGFSNGCETSDDVTVTVNTENVTADAGTDVSICAGESTILTASGGASYQWSTGDTTPSISVAPSVTTTYTVTVFNTNQTASDQASVTVTVNALPNTDAGQDVTITEGVSTTLTATGADTYLWSTGETTASITVSPAGTTTYSVTGFSNGCETSDDVTVTVNTENVTADAGTDVSICAGESTVLTASGGASYQWSTGDTTPSISVAPSVTTTYTVTVFNTNQTASDQASVTVTVNALPNTDAGQDVTITEGASTTLTATGADTYLWSTGETTASITVSPAGTTTYSVTGFSNGCESSDDVTVTVNTENVTADAGTDVSICAGESTVLTASGGASYQWSTGETTPSISVAPSVTTTYTVTVFNTNQTASDQASVTVTVNALPNTDAGQDVTITEGTSTTLTATGADTYLWSTGETTASITVSPTGTTTYSVTGFSNSCESSDDVTVTVNTENVTADAGTDVSICAGESTVLTASGGASYQWSTGETTPSISVAPSVTTTYTVTVFNTNQTASDQASVTVTVNALPNTDAGQDVTITEGASTTLTATGADTYLWSTGETTASITVSPTGTTTYSVTGFSNGCESTDTILVTVEPFEFTVSAGGDVAICQGYETTLTATEGDAYLWSTGETTQSITVSPSNTQTYTVTVFLDEYQAEADVTVGVNPNPNVVIMNGDEVMILEGEFVTLSASGANSYVWNNGATQPNIAVSPMTTTVYEVTGFINNCEDTKSIVVNVVETVQADAGDDMTICSDETITLTANGGEAYLWSTGETTQSIEVSPNEDTEYSVLVYNALDSDEDTVMVYVENCSIVELPEESQAFEFIVYQDPLNDLIKVKINGLNNVNARGISIYDLNGRQIYTEMFSPSEVQTQSQMTRTINASAYARGVYMVQLIYDDTKITKKIPIR
ncbi:T9SS type A sorting domain-containing protein [Psychroserpens sp. BH13MA-6]